MSKIIDNINDIETIVSKQDTLVSGTNIKTVNGESVLGSGNMLVGATIDYQEFTTSGTWTKPVGCNYVYVEVLGAGGGGSSGVSFNQSGYVRGGAGAGGGAYTSKLIPQSELANSINVVVGAGGAGGNNVLNSVIQNAGGNGGLSSFWTIEASGGVGGTGTSSSISASIAGGAGGGNISYRTFGGAGGNGGAGTTSSGVIVMLPTFGGKGGDGAGIAAITSQHGIDGNTGCGGDGGKGIISSSLNGGNGGKGGNGLVKVWAW